MSSDRGFTLIEALVSIALGASICATAFVGVRTVATTMASGNRLSVENRLMRAGVAAALDDLDTWASFDTPGDQPLRAAGDPFSPLPALAEDFNFEFNPVRRPGDSDELWWRRNSRTWFRGDLTHPNWGARSEGLGDFTLFGYLGYGDGTLLHGAEKAWHHRLVHTIGAQLGNFALVDYLPASEFYLDYEDPGDGDIRSPALFRTLAPGGTNTLLSRAWWEDKPHDFVCLLAGTFLTITVPSRSPAPYSTGGLGDADAVGSAGGVNHAMFQATNDDANYDNDVGLVPPQPPAAGWSVNDGYDVGGTRLAMTPLRPASWPQLDVRVRHYAANSRQFHGATILMRSPITGQVFKLAFTATATTLRGARRERGLDPDAPAAP